MNLLGYWCVHSSKYPSVNPCTHGVAGTLGDGYMSIAYSCPVLIPVHAGTYSLLLRCTRVCVHEYSLLLPSVNPCTRGDIGRWVHEYSLLLPSVNPCTRGDIGRWVHEYSLLLPSVNPCTRGDIGRWVHEYSLLLYSTRSTFSPQLIYWLVAWRPSNMLVYLTDGSAQTILRAATLR